MVPFRHHILLVEDDLDHRFLAQRALGKVVKEPSSIHVVSTGNEAIEYLLEEGQNLDHGSHPFPSIIITDLKMHDGDGFDVLEFLGANPAWCIVPRIVLTTSDSEDDIRLAYELGASAYHLKPASLHETEQQMAQIIGYWSSIHVTCTDHPVRLVPTAATAQREDGLPRVKARRHIARPDRTERYNRPASRAPAKLPASSLEPRT